MDLFLKACGAPGPLHLAVASVETQVTTHQVLNQPFVLIGREAQLDLPLNHRLVSRRHAYLQVIDGRIFCVDLQSHAGTFWSYLPARYGWLSPDQGIRIGPYQIRLWEGGFEDPDRAALPPGDVSPLASQPFSRDPLPGVSLEFGKGTAQPALWRMNRPLVLLGRSPQCKVQLISSSVSRFHCSLLRTPLGIWVTDLLSRQGITVNGARVRFARLDDGDQLQVGRFLIRVWYHAPPNPSRSPEAVVRAEQPAGDSRNVVAGSDSVSQLVIPCRPLAQAAAAPPDTALDSPLASLQHIRQVLSGESPDKAAQVEALLMPLVNQFNWMQQHMFDQFHQTMLMLVQMFSTLHRDQMKLVREELLQVQQLTRELHDLQDKLARHQQAAAAPVKPAAAPAKAVRPHGVARREPAPAYDKNGMPPAERPPRTEPPAPAGASSGDPIQSSEDVHAWLCQRIDAIHQERQSRWEQILNFVLGK
jgi:pSer/pThr/pTyr-binding forkhead associated (FHA) protein